MNKSPIETKIDANLHTKPVPSEGPALWNDRGAHTANVDQRLAEIKRKRELQNRAEGRKTRQATRAKVGVGLGVLTASAATAVAGALFVKGNQMLDKHWGLDNPVLVEKALAGAPETDKKVQYKHYEVQPGDTAWTIAQRAYPEDAKDASDFFDRRQEILSQLPEDEDHRNNTLQPGDDIRLSVDAKVGTLVTSEDEQSSPRG